MRNRGLLIICLLIGVQLMAQELPSFFVRILDPIYVPVVSHTTEGIPINTTNTGLRGLDGIINGYEIYSVERKFETFTSVSLQNLYLIQCNDLQLMTDLFDNYSIYYPHVADAYFEPLYLPNDLGTVGGHTEVDQEELNYIRAQEAWDITKGNSNVIIGVADSNFQPLHEDLIGKVTVFGNNNPNSTAQHGSRVSSFAAANTDNNTGMSAIGFDSSIYAVKGGSEAVATLADIPGVKVINTAWRSSANEETYNEVVENRNIVVVGSAGNTAGVGTFIYPAAFKNVISVSAVGHQNENFNDGFGLVETWKDLHEFKINGQLLTFNHNDSVDVVAPGYAMVGVYPGGNGTGLDAYLNNGLGTSFSSPIVSGTIALMFSMNYCLKPKEVETILKLTAIPIDGLLPNIAYYGKLGAGKIDAYEAVKMAKAMKDEFGVVEVKDRLLYRPWFYKLDTAPYKIEMTNNSMIDGAKVKFRARDNIVILSGDYSPVAGYIELFIDPTDTTCEVPTITTTPSSNSDKSNESGLINIYDVFPTLVDAEINVENLISKEAIIKTIRIYNLFNQELFVQSGINTPDIMLDVSKLPEGIYILKGYNGKTEIVTTKFVKK